MSNQKIKKSIYVLIGVMLLAGSGFIIAFAPPPPTPTWEIPNRDSEEEDSADEMSEESEIADALNPVNDPQMPDGTSDEIPYETSYLSLPDGSRPMSSDLEPGQHAAQREARSLKEAGLVTIRRVPTGDSEIESAWKQASSNSCDFIPPNQPFEIRRPTSILTENDRMMAGRRNLVPSTRQHMMSIGLHLPREVQQSLPALGKIPIMDYIQRHYVTIQARVNRDPVNGMAYLSHRPMAATMQYSGQKLTMEFNETVSTSVKDFRSLGLWLSPDEEATPQNLRTLVLADRHIKSESKSKRLSPKTAFELMFVRARVQNKSSSGRERPYSKASAGLSDSNGSNLVLHTFVTTNGRQQLHWIPPDTEVRDSQQCGIRVLVKFTAYSHGAYPTESVVIGQEVRSSATYSEEKLNRFVQEKGWTGGRFGQLSQLLDAIIDKELTSD